MDGITPVGGKIFFGARLGGGGREVSPELRWVRCAGEREGGTGGSAGEKGGGVGEEGSEGRMPSRLIGTGNSKIFVKYITNHQFRKSL